MIIVLLFFFQLLFLFLLSRLVHRRISHFFFSVTKSIKMTVSVMAFLFLPGTLLHEISHFLMAHLMFVPVGEMTLTPKIEGTSVRLGSVMIGKTDPLRRLLIGVAPFLIGTCIILGTLFLAQEYQAWKNIWLSIGIIYILFEIGNTMFSSKKDLEGAVSLVILLTVIISLLFILGIRIPLDTIQQIFSDTVVHTFYQGVIFLSIPIGIDLLLIFLFSSLTFILRRR